jgi:hypothetical protein
MEEADALATRIAIQAGGNLRCLGNQVHLKRRYGSGYLNLKVVLQLRMDVPHNMKDVNLIKQQKVFSDVEEDLICKIDAFFISLNIPGGFWPSPVMADQLVRRNHIKLHDEGFITWQLTEEYAFADDVGIAKVFAGMDAAKESLNILEWTVEHSTLEVSISCLALMFCVFWALR